MPVRPEPLHTRPGRLVGWTACLLMTAAVLAACGASKKPAAPDASTEPTNPVAEPEMTDPNPPSGPPIAPSEPLRAWLDDHKGTTIQLPVVVETKVLGLGGAWIAMTDDDAGEDAIHLILEDSQMGIGLGDRLRSTCGNPPRRCLVWLEGKWGATFAISGPLGGPGGLGGLGGGKKDASPFSVRRLVAPVEPGDDAVVRLGPAQAP